LELVFYGAGLSKRYRPDSSATYMEPLHTGDGLVGLSKKIPYIITPVLEPWIMTQPMEKNCPVLYQKKPSRGGAYSYDCQMENDNINFGFSNPISIILTGLI
jgi:hypothetical protein